MKPQQLSFDDVAAGLTDLLARSYEAGARAMLERVMADYDKQRAKMTLTIAEAAEELRVDETTVRRRVLAGEIPSLTIGTRRLIRREALAEYLVQQERDEPRNQDAYARPSRMRKIA